MQFLSIMSCLMLIGCLFVSWLSHEIKPITVTKQGQQKSDLQSRYTYVIDFLFFILTAFTNLCPLFTSPNISFAIFATFESSRLQINYLKKPICQKDFTFPFEIAFSIQNWIKVDRISAGKPMKVVLVIRFRVILEMFLTMALITRHLKIWFEIIWLRKFLKWWREISLTTILFRY